MSAKKNATNHLEAKFVDDVRVADEEPSSLAVPAPSSLGVMT